MFHALKITNDGEYRTTLTQIDEAELPSGEVLVEVAYSTLNYKDALAITGKGPIARRFPMVPGIDFAGTVMESSDARFKAGDRALLNGFGVGETHWGGLSQRARVMADWLTPHPEAFDFAQSMALGTAGYTAMLSVMALQKHGLTPASGDILVTGANGGVGTIAISLLHALGFTVVASTGRLHEAEYLKSLGATTVIDRAELSSPGKPLAKERWAGAIDSVGSHTLANVCAGLKADGAVAACGLAQGMDFPATVAPFILRGITLYGINSVYRPMTDRIKAWDSLARLIDRDMLAANTRTLTLKEALGAATDLLNGSVRGRLIVDVSAVML
jgi:acrylyl-CoA reductase (NADPH)